MPSLIALVTCTEYPELYPEDKQLIPELARRSLTAEPVIWDDPEVDWGRYDAIVLRSPWDYCEKIPLFRHWLQTMQGRRLFNPAELALWNFDKRYLRELDEKGIPLPPTLFATFESDASFRQQLESLPWKELIVKPAISAGAFHMVRLNAAAEFRNPGYEPGSSLIVQPYLREIETEGEWSLIYFDNQFSHAVHKVPKANDFRVQHKFGGSRKGAEPPAEARTVADRVLATLEEVPLYARVDLTLTSAGFALMELELLEPHLYWDDDPKAPKRFADALSRRLMH